MTIAIVLTLQEVPLRYYYYCGLFVVVFQKIISGILSECQTVWIQIRHDILSGLIWVQSVCKDYQQTTLGDKELKASD